LSYEKLRKFDAALREYELAAATLPEAYLYMGNAYFQQKNFSKAEKAYQKAIAETRNPAAYNNLAWLYHETNANLEEAETLSRKAVELSPGNENYGDTLARILEKRRR
jgi:tetratricopeptide (TPR) repeat protein